MKHWWGKVEEVIFGSLSAKLRTNQYLLFTIRSMLEGIYLLIYIYIYSFLCIYMYVGIKRNLYRHLRKTFKRKMKIVPKIL